MHLQRLVSFTEFLTQESLRLNHCAYHFNVFIEINKLKSY